MKKEMKRLKGKLTKIEVRDSMNISCIHEDKFTTGRISIALLLPLENDTVAPNAILPFLLKRSTEKHKTFTELNRMLSMMFGASLSAGVKKLKDSHMLYISVEGIDDRYTIGRSAVFSELADLLLEVLYKPNIVDGEFPLEDIRQERREIIDLLDSEINDKRIYSKNRLIELMFKGEPYGINPFGTKEQIAGITNGEIVKAWERAKNNARIEGFIVGISNPDPVIDKLKQAFLESDRGEIADSHRPTSRIERKEVREYVEKFNVAQSKLAMGFRTPNSENKAAVRLMSVIFGGTPSSKLFTNVREKLSLCYYCSASYTRLKDFMLVQSGVEHSNIERTKQEILHQLEEMKKGNFSQDDIIAARLSLVNAFNTISDGINSLEDHYMMQLLDDKMLSPKEQIDLINKVTKDEIVEAAGGVTLDTVYTLTDKGGGSNEE